MIYELQCKRAVNVCLEWSMEGFIKLITTIESMVNKYYWRCQRKGGNKSRAVQQSEQVSINRRNKSREPIIRKPDKSLPLSCAIIIPTVGDDLDLRVARSRWRWVTWVGKEGDF